MKCNALGTTDIRICRVCVGCMSLEKVGAIRSDSRIQYRLCGIESYEYPPEQWTMCSPAFPRTISRQRLPIFECCWSKAKRTG